jgi:hypothetical protein
VRAPPDFREELHPEEIVRRPASHPWLASIALVVLVTAIGILLRAIAPFGADAPKASQQVVTERGGTPLARAASGSDERGTVTRSSR